MDKAQPWNYFPLMPVFAFTSEKKARKFVKSRTGLRLTSSGKSGTCVGYERDDGQWFAVILLDCEDSPTPHKYAILAHECVHYSQHMEDYMGEKFDSETEAYVIQSAMRACIDQIGEEWFDTTPQA